MIKRKILTVSTSFLVFAALLFVLTGCSKNSQTPNQTQVPSNDQPATAGKPGRMRMPDFGQPNRQADIRGVVKSIVGNSVTVLKIDMGSFRQGGQGGATSSTSTDKTAPAISLSGTTTGSRGGNGGGRMGGGGFGGQGGPGGQTAETRAQMLEKLKAMSTGEETVIIPVGIQMLKPSTDAATNKRTMVEATLDDITSDKTITIWLNTAVTDKKVADFVLIN